MMRTAIGRSPMRYCRTCWRVSRFLIGRVLAIGAVICRILAELFLWASEVLAGAAGVVGGKR
jgi:hypothetical protein